MNVVCLKCRLLPSKSQETLLSQTLDLCRQVYNSLVIERTACYEVDGTSLTYRHQQNVSLKSWRAKFPELQSLHSQIYQNIAVRVDLAFKAFFRRVKNGGTSHGGAVGRPGYPRLKGPGVYDSITFPQAQVTGCVLKGDQLKVTGIGSVKCVVHRPLQGKVKTCTIRRQSGKWFACFSCEVEPEPLPPLRQSPALSVSNESIGIDAETKLRFVGVGLEKFAALSDGTFVGNPRFFRQDEKALAKAQRKQSKHKKGSTARRKANKVVARIHERIRNRRHNFVHQLSRKIVNRFGLIALENLAVKNLLGNHHLAKSISDAAQSGPSPATWSQFRFCLTYKAAQGVCAAVAGRQVAAVNPAFTSQDCSGCGYRAKKPLKERWHHCPMCGLSLDRDTNAAHNILFHAVRERTALGQQSVAGTPA